MNYIDIPCCKGKKVRIKATSLIHSQRSAYQEIAIYDTEEFGRCLFLDDTIQCSEKDHEIYDRALLNKLRQTDKRILILGGGDGYTAEMLLKINPDAEITVVELDKEVIYACKKHLGQDVFDHPNVNLIFDDAFHYMKQADKGSYDGIVCDLTDFPVGYNDGKFRDFYSSIFAHSNEILSPSGWIAIYAGTNADSIADILSRHFKGIEKAEVLIPSFGEPSVFLYAEQSRGGQVIEVITDADGSILKEIMSLRGRSFPKHWLEEDWTDYYRESLKNSNNINIVIRQDSKIIGYLLAVPHNAAIIELKDDDPEMREDAERYYVDLIVIDPEFQRGRGFLRMRHKMFEEAEKRFGVNKFSMHARVNTGLSRVVQRYFGGIITSVRRIERWTYYSGEEPADYIEGTYKK